LTETELSLANVQAPVIHTEQLLPALRSAKIHEMSEQKSSKAQAVETKSPEAEAKKPITPEEFITRWPLYSPAHVEGFYPPTRVSFHCDGKCAKETTWLRMADPEYESLSAAQDGFKWVWYLCGLCNRNYLLVVYRESEHQKRQIKRATGLPPTTTTIVTKVQKIGQYPALSIDVSKGLEKNLGQNAISLYKKGLINRNSGYGLGAVTYIRRVVEDKTDELIEVAAQLAESHNVDALIVKRIRAAATERTTYDMKLKIAATVLPDALIIDGVNPLAQLYSLVSEGVHELTEEQCIAVADETTSVFEFIFTNLRATIKARHDFVDKVKKWAGLKAPQQNVTAGENEGEGKSGGE
jgi:hypothetical protein